MSQSLSHIGEIGEYEIMQGKIASINLKYSKYCFFVKSDLFESIQSVIKKMIDKKDSVGLHAIETYLSFDRFHVKENDAINWLTKAIIRSEHADEYIRPILDSIRQRGGLAKTYHYNYEENEEV